MGTAQYYEDFPVRIRQAEVVRVTHPSATTLRITFGGEGARGFESGIFDEHVKMLFPDPDTGDLRLPVPDGDELDWPRPFPTSREYTVRAHRPEVDEFDIDVVAHDGGLASTWAQNARVGDRLHIAGPPGGYRIGEDYDVYVLAGDETALPAIARWLEEAPPDTRGHVVIEVPGPESEQLLTVPPHVEVTWLHTDPTATDLFERTVRNLDLSPEDDVFVWLAGEAGMIKPLRRWVREDLGLTREHSSITGYWKRGRADTHEHLDDDHGAPDDHDAHARVEDGPGARHDGPTAADGI